MMQMCDVVLPLAISEIERDWGAQMIFFMKLSV